jgi:outer membrane protein, heavy metal efflux system
VSSLFSAYVTAEQSLTLARSGAEGFEATALLAQRQREAGNITAYRLATEESAAVEARFTATRAALEMAQLREELQQHLGLWGPRTGWSAIAALPEPAEDAPALDTLEQRAVAQRLDLEHARQEVALADQALALARTFRFVGAFDLGVHAHQDPEGARLLGPTLQLELPLFDQRQALLARLEAQQAQAEHQLRARAVAVRSQVRLAFTRLEAARTLARTAQTRLVPLRAQAVAEAQRLYNGMLIGLYELMAARQADLEAQQTALSARRDYWVARAELVRALGGRWNAPASAGAPHD